MKILMITPPTGGIDVYVSRLAQEMQRLGYEVDLLGCQRNEMAYDIDNKKWRTSQEAKSLVKRVIHQVDFASYDVVAFHYGKNDLEQYFPVALRGEGVKINKSVYFVHFLSWNLFSDYLGDEDSRVEVEEAVYSSFDQYLFFGEFARKFLTNKADHSLSGIVSYLPETHSHESVSESETREILAKYMSDESNNIETIFFPGFAANYKDHNLLLESLRYVDRPINLVFAGQGWSKRLGFDKKRINNVNTYVVDDYLTGKEYKVLSEKSLMGVFPYRQPTSKDEYFQGSGTLPNFIYAGKACVVLNEGAMPEYVGNSGIVVRDATAMNFAKAINELLDPKTRRKYEEKAIVRRPLFSVENHAQDCINLFKTNF